MLFVKAVTAPVASILKVPVLVKVAIVDKLAPEVFTVPAFVRVPPVPAKVPEILTILLLVTFTPVTVALTKLNEPVPPKFWSMVLNVAPPTAKTFELLFVIPPLNTTRETVVAVVEVQVPPEFMVTSPVKVLVEVFEVIEKSPELDVEPETVKVFLPTTRAPVLAIFKFKQVELAVTL
jgi:hypothetical protein